MHEFDNTLTSIWNSALSLIKNDIPRNAFETWFKSTEIIAYFGNIIVIKVPNTFAVNQMEMTYKPLINKHLNHLLNDDIHLRFVTAMDKDSALENIYTESGYTKSDFISIDPIPTAHPADNNEDTYLNSKYTFDTFVIGNSNRFTHAACVSVAEAVAKQIRSPFNPLFIHGDTGLGKTHLMHAIGNYVREHNPSLKIKYVSSEKFTNELIDGIKDNKTAEFRNKYRKVDVLLIDDIQFLAKKESTQEEFFHTFNELHEANKQIIISSDRPPREIPTLEDRLRTRFEWGLTTEIQAPDYETRIAILRKKAQLDQIDIPNDVFAYIAENIQSNIRELEGILTRLYAYSELNKRKIDLDLAQECLHSIIPAQMPVIITGELIQQKVAEFYSLKVDDLKAKKRTRTVAYPRQIAMYLCREMTDMSLPKIGEIFGGRDHTTVIHAHEKITNDLKKDASLQLSIEQLKKDLSH